MNFALSTIDVVIITASILIVVIVGLLAARNQDKSARGYFLASGRMPWYIIGAAFVSTSVSSEQIVGTVGAAYRAGMGVANWEWFSLPVYALLVVFFIPMFLRTKITTIPELLNRRFGPACGSIYSWIMLLAYVFIFLVPVLYGGSLAFAELTGWSFELVLWGTVLLVMLYTIKGGLASVMWTDAVQCVMLVGGGVLLFFLALHKIDSGWSGWSLMEAANPDRFHLYRPPTDPVAPFLGILLGSFGVFIFYQAANQVMVQRVLGARSTWDGMMGIIFAGLINMLRPLVTCFLGLIVFHWINVMHQAAPLANPDKAFPFALKAFAPEWGLRGIILAGFTAAVMSTVSALANSTATIFSLDVYHRVINRNADDRTLVSVGRWASFAALLIAAVVAPSVEHLGGIFTYFQTGVTYLAVPFATVLIFGLFWKRANYPSALFGLIGGVAIMVGVVVADFLLRKNGVYAQWGLPNGLHWIYLGFIAQVIIAVGMAIVALATPPPAPEAWKPFQWSPSQLRDLEGGAKWSWYQTWMLWLGAGLYLAVWMWAYWRFW